MQKNLILIVLLSNSLYLFGQQFDSDRLLQISEVYRAYNLQRKQRLLQFPENQRIKVMGDDFTLHLFDITEKGDPVYIGLHNQEARSTIGVEYTQSPEGLNLPYYGEGIRVGVWDGGNVNNLHQELIGRVKNEGVADINFHATHVTGTILATGITARAKGMAPLANAVSYYAFESDVAEMALEASRGLLVSNHSYGLVLGWEYDSSNDTWDWFGQSNGEDTRFGLYTEMTQAFDDIAFNAPYYTIVVSAGNDRSDVGDGKFPPDGPYDILGPRAVNKNGITVGAITGYDVYTKPSDAVMSSFSSWGPTNDYRIKPDLVSDGVSVYSTYTGGADSYGTLSGTSMAAPGVAGGVVIIQEAAKAKTDTFLTSALLKATIIHTVDEAGEFDGPDFEFGWGVMNVAHAVEVINNSNERDTLLYEHTLNQGETNIYEVTSDGLTPLNVTIAWTDPPGSIKAASDTSPSLINDLDIRVYDESNSEYLPWTMGQTSFRKAIKGDDSINNIEKIGIDVSEPGKYVIKVSHKGTLLNGSQDYGLVITSNAITENASLVYYFRNSVDQILSNTLNWSSDAMQFTPIESADLGGLTLVIDDQSISGTDTLYLSDELVIQNLIVKSKDTVRIDLKGNIIQLSGKIIQEGILELYNGELIFINEFSSALEGLINSFDICGSNTTIRIKPNYSLFWENSALSCDSLIIESGNFSINESSLDLDFLSISSSEDVSLQRNNISLSGAYISNTSFESIDNSWTIQGGEFNVSTGVDLLDSLLLYDVSTKGNFFVNSLTLTSGIILDGSIETENLLLTGPASIEIRANSAIRAQTIELDNSEENEINIEGVAQSEIHVGNREKYCFDYLTVMNIDFVSESRVILGPNSSVDNSTGFLIGNCEEFPFADFKVDYNCVNALITVENLSSGNIQQVEWNSNGLNSLRNDEELFFFASEPGEYTIELTVTDGAQSDVFSQIVKIDSLQQNELTIRQSSQGLIASLNSKNYDWYLNGEIYQAGLESRILEGIKESGIYNAIILSNDPEDYCKTNISQDLEVIVLGIDENVDLRIFPNPFVKEINLFSDREYILQVSDLEGRILLDVEVEKGLNVINLNNLSSGTYILSSTDLKSYSNYKQIIIKL